MNAMMYGKSQMSMLIGEFTPDCLTIRVAKSLGGYEVSLLQRKLRDGSLNGEISTPEGGADRDRKIADRSQHKGVKLEVPGEQINLHTSCKWIKLSQPS
jgi:hypothetical protein